MKKMNSELSKALILTRISSKLILTLNTNNALIAYLYGFRTKPNNLKPLMN